MKKIALIVALLGLNLVMAQDAQEIIDEEVEYIEDEEVEYVEDLEAEESAEADISVEIQPTQESQESTQITQDSKVSESSDIAVVEEVDGRDITRWNYTKEDLIKKEEKARRQAELEERRAMNITRKRSGMFLGVGIGYYNMSMSGFARPFVPTEITKNQVRVEGIGANFTLGYQKALSEYAGFRAYGEVDYNAGFGVIYAKADGGNSTRATNNMVKGLANVDVYVEGNFGRNDTETLGAFVGIGGGYIYNKGSDTVPSYHAVTFVVNYGFHTIIGDNHRIELFARSYPLINATKTTDSVNKNSITAEKNWVPEVWLKYNYMF